MKMLIVKLLYQLYGEFSICLFVYGILWLAEAMDIEDAIDEVLKKYPQFKAGLSKDEDDDNDDETEKKKSWGQRQRGGSKKTSGVEAAFLKRNPGLKID